MILLLNANALHIPLADQSVHCCVTSPPYWGLRDYGIGGQLGLEQTPEDYVANMVAVFREVWRVLRDDGTLWLNIGDSYWGGKGQSAQAWSTEHLERDTLQKAQHQITGLGETRPQDGKHDVIKPKDLVGIPWRVAFALQADGWYLRSDIIWSKPNPMPESVTDRPTKAHEYLFLLAKQPRYYYDADAVREAQSEATFDRFGNGNAPRKVGTGKHGKSDGFVKPDGVTGSTGILPAGRNRRTVWTIATAPYSGSHFATFPPDLVRPRILAGSSPRACEHCGAPWERVVEKGEPKAGIERGKHASAWRALGQPQQSCNGGLGTREVTTSGWQPTCTCGGDPVPAIVLDPFAGSGTTLLVARQLGRRGVGLDLSYSYLHEQARKRLGLDALDAWTNGIAVNDDGYHDLPMFREAT